MKLWFMLSITLTVLAVASALVVYTNRAEWLPEKVPTHWNAHNVADQYTSRDDMLFYLLLPPGCMVVLMVLAVLLPWLSPRHFKVEPFRATWDYIMALIVVLLSYIHVVLLAAYMQKMKDSDFPRWLVGGILVILAMLGNRLGKVQRNFWMGVRTPWTLASDTVWIRTHRLAAWTFTGGALVGLVLLLVGLNPIIAMSVFGVAAVYPVFYSLWLYKHLEKAGLLEKNDVPAPVP
jgi:uncharacterized membrane protein